MWIVLLLDQDLATILHQDLTIQQHQEATILQHLDQDPTTLHQDLALIVVFLHQEALEEVLEVEEVEALAEVEEALGDVDVNIILLWKKH